MAKKRHTKDRKVRQDKAQSMQSALGYAGKIAAGLLLLYGIVVGADSVTKSYDSKKTTEELFNRFPTTIPGAAEIRKYPVDHPASCLVHVKNMHYIPDAPELQVVALPPDVVKSHNKESMKTQKDIYTILDYLSKWSGEKHVFCEGWTPELVSYLSPEKIHTVNRSSLELFGEVKLYAEGKIIILPGDTKESDMLKEGVLGVYLMTLDSRVLNAPEYKVLDLLSESSYPMKILVYGHGHSFRDNLEAYNNKNPKGSMSLIEVIPKNVHDIFQNTGTF